MANEAANSKDSPTSEVIRSDSTESLVLGGILALIAFTYAATLRFQFTYDDEGQIVENTLVQSWRFVPQYFKGHVWQQMAPNALGNYYRPLNVLWFRLNDALFGLRPAGWHATTVLLHLLATLCAYLVARRLTGRPMVAALTALLFGLHPMRHEVVAWVSGSTESLWSVLILVAFLAYLKSREVDRWLWMAVSCGLYATGMLAKETAIVFPLLVLAHAWIYGDDAHQETALPPSQRLGKAASLAMVYVPVAIAYLAVRVSVLRGFAHSLTGISPAEVALTLPSVLFFYVRQWFLPIRLAEFYALPVIQRFDARHVVLPLLGLAVLGGLLWLFRKKLGSREVAFAAIWMVLFLLPAMDLGIFPRGQLVHDRYFYLSGFGAALLTALVLEQLAKNVRAPRVFGYSRGFAFTVLGVVLLLCYSTANAASYWEDDYILFQHAYELDPGSALVRNNFAIELARRSQFDLAIPMLQQVLRDEPDNWLANYNLGRVYYNLGALPSAERYLEHAQQIDPALPDSYLQLGLIALRTSHYDVAEVDMRKCVALRPFEPSLHFALGVTLASRGNCAEARSEFAEALVLKPGFAKAQEQMGKCTPATTPTSLASPVPASGVAPVIRETP